MNSTKAATPAIATENTCPEEPEHGEPPTNEGLGPLTSAVLESSTKAAAEANARLTAPSLFVGECVDASHPTLTGRVLARFAAPNGTTRELWMPTLHGL